MLLLFTRKSWTFLLEPLADSPSSRCLRVSQRRLLDEFHSIFFAKLTPVQFLDKGVDVPVVACLVIVVLKTVEVLQLLVDVGLSSSLTRFCHAFSSSSSSWTRLSMCSLLCTSWFMA